MRNDISVKKKFPLKLKLVLKAYRIIVAGIVQGVGYRASVFSIAIRTGVRGHVRNLPDGRVEILAQAWDDDKLEAFIESIRTVKAPARVDDISRTEIGFSDAIKSFKILR